MEIDRRVIPPQSIEVIRLPWIERLSQIELNQDETLILSTQVPHGAYQVQTTLPVTVYQFNPLNYSIPQDCIGDENDEIGDDLCYSYTNDASLLLPVHTLRQSYIAMSYSSSFAQDPSGGGLFFYSPSSFQVVAVKSGETIVTLESGGRFLSVSGNEIQTNEEDTYTLQQGEVLQIMAALPQRCSNESRTPEIEYCLAPPGEDINGTLIQSTQPVQVFGSHPCTNIPHQYPACDHIEESLFPLESWGKSSVVASTQSFIGEPNLVRVFSGNTDNVIQFTPEVHPTVTLQKGEWVEFETQESFEVKGTKPIQVLQFLVGQNYGSSVELLEGGKGDPSMSLVPPSDQFRTDYTFIAPSTYDEHWINIVARIGQEIDLNGQVLSEFIEVPGTSWAVARVNIPEGIYTARSNQTFGIWVYGFGAFTSYMYPAGLDLKPLNDIMN